MCKQDKQECNYTKVQVKCFNSGEWVFFEEIAEYSVEST